MPYEESLHDLHVKYSSTFVGVKLPSGTIIPARVDNISWDSELDEECEYEGREYEEIPADVCSFYLRIYNNPENFEVQTTMKLQRDDLILEYPETLGAAELGDSCVYVSRIANVEGTQKYRKTPSDYTLYVANPTHNEEEELNIPMYDQVYPHYLYKAWNGLTYRPVEEAVELLSAGKRLGCAISEKYSMHITWDYDYLNIAREGYVIGAYDADKKKIYLLDDNLQAFKEELAELGLEIDPEKTISIEMVDPWDRAHIKAADVVPTFVIPQDGVWADINATTAADAFTYTTFATGG